jgi:hypothetical protein
MRGARACLSVGVMLWLCLPCVGSFAEEAAPPSEGETRTLASLGIKGEILFKSYTYFEDAPADDRLYREEGILRLEWSRQFAPWIGAKLIGELRGDTDGDANGVYFDVPDTNRHRSILGLREATVSLRHAPVDVTIGKQIFAWGTADAHNPTDNINPYDYLDVLDVDKMAVYSVAARLQAGPTSLVAAVVPVFTPSRLPDATSRWAPPPPPGVLAIVNDREVPGVEVANVQLAARVRTTLGGWDLSASYYQGFEDVPEFRAATVTTPSGLAVTSLTPVFPRIHAVGMDFSTTVRGIEVHGEGAFKFVEKNGREDRFQVIGGFSYTWDGIDAPWLDAVTLTLEYAREVALRTRDASILPSGGGESELGDLLAFNAFQNTLVGRLLLKVSEDTQVKLTGNLNFDGPTSYYAQVAVAHRFTDALQAEAGLDFIGGDARSFWGRWAPNDRVFVVLRYLF